MRDQADELRALVRQFDEQVEAVSGAGPKLVVVSSGKGGVGTTTVAVQLAVCLARAGQRAVLIDADPNRSDVAEMCHVEAKINVADVVSGRRALRDALQPGPAGVRVLAGPWASADWADASPEAQERLLAEIKTLGGDADVVVMDAGSGLGRSMRRFWRAADVLLVVTATEAQALMDTYAAIKVLLPSDFSAPIRSFVNLAIDEATARAVGDRLSQVSYHFLGLGVTEAGWLERDDSVGDAARENAPPQDRSISPRARGAFERLAAEIVNSLRAPRPVVLESRVAGENLTEAMT